MTEEERGPARPVLERVVPALLGFGLFTVCTPLVFASAVETRSQGVLWLVLVTALQVVVFLGGAITGASLGKGRRTSPFGEAVVGAVAGLCVVLTSALILGGLELLLGIASQAMRWYLVVRMVLPGLAGFLALRWLTSKPTPAVRTAPR